MEYGRLKGLRIEDYQYPGEQNAFDKLRKLPLLDQLLDAYIKFQVHFNALPEIQGDCFRVTQSSCPKIWDLYQLALERMDMPQVYPLYIRAEYAFNASAYHGKDPVITVNSSIIKNMPDGEILAVLGHELGHIKGKHGVYNTMASYIGQLISMVPLLGRALNTAFMITLINWLRMHEYTCDRAGMIAAGDPEAAINCDGRMLGGYEDIPGIHFCKDDYLAQAKEFGRYQTDAVAGVYASLSLMYASHPWQITRIMEMEKWRLSGEFDELIARYAK